LANFAMKGKEMGRLQKPETKMYRYIAPMKVDQALKLCIERYQQYQVARGTSRNETLLYIVRHYT